MRHKPCSEIEVLLGQRLNETCPLCRRSRSRERDRSRERRRSRSRDRYVQGVEAEAEDPDLPVLAIKARKLRIGNVNIGCIYHAGWELSSLHF